MKRLILVLSLLLTTNSVFAYNYSGIVKNSLNVNQKVNYSPETMEWHRNVNPSNINFTKQMTIGSGSYTEFVNDSHYYDTNTTYEFFDGNKLLGHNMHLLKFFELDFDKKITQRELTPDELKVLFPDVEIVYISKFKNNKIVLRKPKNVKRTYLLINDTDKDFYKYSFENHDNQTELIKGLFEIDKPQKLIFSHFGSRDKLFPILTIIVKNSLFAK
ncbi:TPA: hypothetical protein IAC10_13380 [Candidatus Scatousia excrementigallinarum]|uniref:Uncharacterized protein n=1 Tax=Candidatus Scatousia excrementigallinarum TaxID=2840935 RepID=A0A9D1JP14_9BACT|nr:hypothetical protein [Candidatus Scatousia excrementigallinarum]